MTSPEALPMRDPQGNLDAYAARLGSEIPDRTELEQTLASLSLENRIFRLGHQLAYDQDYLRFRYGRGVTLDVLRDEALSRLRAMLRDSAFIRQEGGAVLAGFRPVQGMKRSGMAFAALTLLLVDNAEGAMPFHELVSDAKDQQTYLLDLLVKAFDRKQPIAKKYKPNKYAAPWSDPIVRALSLPAEQRPAALARHMGNWTRLMRPYGWKPDLDTTIGKDRLFCDFAFEVALAVCGWDIDDSSFADHPYYPRDLVAWYREHVRQSRDAWREQQAGAGVEITPPLAVKSDLAKTKRKGIARWVELVADGDQDATEAVLDTIGKPRKIKDLDELLAALGEAGVALNADIKDDATLAAQMDALGSARGLDEFEGPAAPPAGPARCTALLRAWDGWLAERGVRLIAIDGDDDAWHAVVVREAWLDELRALAGELGIPLGEPAGLYAD